MLVVILLVNVPGGSGSKPVLTKCLLVLHDRGRLLRAKGLLNSKQRGPLFGLVKKRTRSGHRHRQANQGIVSREGRALM